MQLGVERLLQDSKLAARLKGKRLALLGHPASVTHKLSHSLDELVAKFGRQVSAAFGPQHGMKGDKQDNMIESDDFRDPDYGIPVFSLYGQVRRPTPEMLASFDVLLVDLQDVGCRIYTYLTTLFYMMEALAKSPRQELWVLDRPNPVGRPIEGNRLDMQFASFVGAAPVPMRHGLTLGEAALWYRKLAGLDLNLEVVSMTDYSLEEGPDFGWPQTELAWVNPSPNLPRLSGARQYCGTVLFEGTLLSEGRGTTIPLEIFGAPGIDAKKIIERMQKAHGDWLKGCVLRPAFFEPTFHKFKGQLCSGLQIHVDAPFYDHKKFRPYRLVAAFLKAVHELHPDIPIWRQPPYEYEDKILPIVMLSGGHELMRFVEGQLSGSEYDGFLRADEMSWQEERQEFLLY